MDSTTNRTGDFIAYPTNRVVGTIADAKSARAAIEALLQVGVERGDIDVLHCMVGERILLLSSTFLHRVLRERGLIAMERLMGMLLVMVSVQSL